MANRRAMKLFAVALLAGAAPAYADNATQASRTAQTAAANQRIQWRSQLNARAIASITPRMLATGSPAAGNTVGKPMSDESYEGELTNLEHALLAAKRAYDKELATPIVLPRLLANARPACGNTGGKVDRPSDCSAKETRAAYAAERYYDKEAPKREARIDAAYSKLVAATEVAANADPALKARLLVSGRPACGNTMSKKAVKCVDVALDDDE